MMEKKLKEYVKKGSDAKIRGNLATIAHKLEHCAKAIPLNPIDDYKGHVTRNLLLTGAREIRSAASHFKVDLAAFIWRSRNIFELLLHLKYILISDEAARHFVAQVGGDKREVLGCAISVEEANSLTSQPARQEYQRLTEVLSRNGFDRASPKNVKQIATEVDCLEEYILLYKLYSKFVHPSAWVVMSTPEEIQVDIGWDIFLVKCQQHAIQTLAITEDFLKSRQVSVVG